MNVILSQYFDNEYIIWLLGATAWRFDHFISSRLAQQNREIPPFSQHIVICHSFVARNISTYIRLTVRGKQFEMKKLIIS